MTQKKITNPASLAKNLTGGEPMAWHLREDGGLVVIDAFRVFDLVFMTTNGGPGYYTTEVMGTYIYKSGFADMRMGYAAALSVLNIAVVMLITGVYMYISRRADR